MHCRFVSRSEFFDTWGKNARCIYHGYKVSLPQLYSTTFLNWRRCLPSLLQAGWLGCAVPCATVIATIPLELISKHLWSCLNLKDKIGSPNRLLFGASLSPFTPRCGKVTIRVREVPLFEVGTHLIILDCNICSPLQRDDKRSILDAKTFLWCSTATNYFIK